MVARDYVRMVHAALHHVWWDVVVRGDDAWMRAHNGYMYLSVYLAVLMCVVSAIGRASGVAPHLSGPI